MSDTKSDTDLAAQIKAEARGPLEQLCGIQDRARQAGLMLGFNIGPDEYGKTIVQRISVIKPL